MSCISCGMCQGFCEAISLRKTPGSVYKQAKIDRTMCFDCGQCMVDIDCPAGAIVE